MSYENWYNIYELIYLWVTQTSQKCSGCLKEEDVFSISENSGDYDVHVYNFSDVTKAMSEIQCQSIQTNTNLNEIFDKIHVLMPEDLVTRDESQLWELKIKQGGTFYVIADFEAINIDFPWEVERYEHWFNHKPIDNIKGKVIATSGKDVTIEFTSPIDNYPHTILIQKYYYKDCWKYVGGLKVGDEVDLYYYDYHGAELSIKYFDDDTFENLNKSSSGGSIVNKSFNNNSSYDNVEDEILNTYGVKPVKTMTKKGKKVYLYNKKELNDYGVNLTYVNRDIQIGYSGLGNDYTDYLLIWEK